MIAEKLAVDPEIRIHVNAVEPHTHVLAFVQRRQREVLAIPARATHDVSGGRAAFAFNGVEWADANGFHARLVNTTVTAPIENAHCEHIGAVAPHEGGGNAIAPCDVDRKS